MADIFGGWEGRNNVLIPWRGQSFVSVHFHVQWEDISILATMTLSAISGMPLVSKPVATNSFANTSKIWHTPPLSSRALQNPGFCLALSHATESNTTGHHKIRAKVICAATVTDPVLTDSAAPVPVPAAAEGSENNRFDVSSSCVKPSFRSGPQAAEESEGREDRVEILFLSEGNVCRSIYAEAIFNSLVRQLGVQDELLCSSRATRDYNVGEAPDSRAVQVAQEVNLDLPQDCRAALFVPAKDIVTYDLAIVMDKFNAADVLKEVSVFDTIDPTSRYSVKVRRLGDFCQARQIEDIDDPLYGNMGGPDELENLRGVYEEIKESCGGLVDQLMELRGSRQDGCSFQKAVGMWLLEMETMDWMVPPMLQKR